MFGAFGLSWGNLYVSTYKSVGCGSSCKVGFRVQELRFTEQWFLHSILGNLGSCQKYGPVLSSLNIRCRIIIGTPKGTIILTTTHLEDQGLSKSSYKCLEPGDKLLGFELPYLKPLLARPLIL